MFFKDCTATKARVAIALNQWTQHNDTSRTIAEMAQNLGDVLTVGQRVAFLGHISAQLQANNLPRARKLLAATVPTKKPTKLLIALVMIYVGGRSVFRFLAWPTVVIASVIVIAMAMGWL